MLSNFVRRLALFSLRGKNLLRETGRISIRRSKTKGAERWDEKNNKKRGPLSLFLLNRKNNGKRRLPSA